MGKLVIFGKDIIVESFMGDTRFDRCILLAKISPDAFGLAKLPPRVAYTRLLASCPFETTLPLPGDTLRYYAARVGTLVQQQHLEQQQQAAEEAGSSSSKLFLQNLAG